ncbi:hypothetical protein ELQ35_09630 [Peribacillus cavernae]|uniref:Uncharacterized protein n=1 Tax=Peribacillus cavernae TaxID=1674310 RepID=A0A3S0U420_9BACI|nr:hypothetical protein [Peribacillus cavernae]RUQ30577.1 hypothetical protein ELQ35_09630 [Peribacillus cavernae]
MELADRALDGVEVTNEEALSFLECPLWKIKRKKCFKRTLVKDFFWNAEREYRMYEQDLQITV